MDMIGRVSAVLWAKTDWTMGGKFDRETAVHLCLDATKEAIKAAQEIPAILYIKASEKTACETAADMEDYWRILWEVALRGGESKFVRDSNNPSEDEPDNY